MSRDLRYKYHSLFVQTWLDTRVQNLSNKDLARLLKQGITAIYQKSNQVLSHVTLHHVLDRVLFNSRGRFPLLNDVVLEIENVNFEKLIVNADRFDKKMLLQASHHLITEFLMVLGTLTAEQLTPLSHQALEEIKGRE